MPRAQICLDRFRCALEMCEMHDLGFIGDVFTWRNKQTKGNTHIRERLNRVVANPEWRAKFPLVLVKNGDTYHSDHRPVVMSLEGQPAVRRSNGNGCSKFEASWLQEEDCR